MRIKTIIRKQREYKRMGLVIEELLKFKTGIRELYIASEILTQSDHTGVDVDVDNCLSKEIAELRKQRNEMEV